MATLIEQVRATIKQLKAMSKEETLAQLAEIKEDGEDYFHQAFLDYNAQAEYIEDLLGQDCVNGFENDNTVDSTILSDNDVESKKLDSLTLKSDYIWITVNYDINNTVALTSLSFSSDDVNDDPYNIVEAIEKTNNGCVAA